MKLMMELRRPKTLHDVIKTMGMVNLTTHIFGATAEFLSEFRERFQQIGKVIARERGDVWGDEEAARKVPLDYPLNEEAERPLDELHAWLETQHPGYVEAFK